MRYRKASLALDLSSALLLAASWPAMAQVVDLSGGSPITDIEIADTPQSFLSDQELIEALNKAFDAALVSGSDFHKGDIAGATIAAFGTRGEDIIGSFNLDQVPGLQFGTAGNKAAVEQDGQRNLAQIDQTLGTGGWAAINQAGEDSATFVNQADTRAPGQASLNRSYVGQVGFATPTGSTLYSNLAEVDQTHRSFDLTAGSFSGSNLVNYATIQQGGFREGGFTQVPVDFNAVAEQNRALIEQDGAGNDGAIQQAVENPSTFVFELGDLVGRNNRAILRQVGFGNRGVILQEDDANAITTQYGSDNLAFVRQDGDVMDGGQYSLIEQGLLESDASNNFAAVFQRGIRQESTIRQLSGDNAAYVYQTAESGYARSAIEQRGGTGNFASVFQAAPSFTVAQGVVSTILQDGSGNEAFVTQRTPGSASAISQTGNDNFARVQQ